MDGQLRESVREHDRRLHRINGSIDAAEVAVTDLSSRVGGVEKKIDVLIGQVRLGIGVVAITFPILTGIIVYLVTHNPT